MEGGDKHYEPKNWKNIQNQGKYKTYDSNTKTYFELPNRHCKFIRKTIMNINSGEIHNGQKTTVNKNENGITWVTETGDPIKLEYSNPYLSITTTHGTSKVYNDNNTELLLPIIFNPGDLYDYYSQCMTFKLESDFGNFTLNRKFYKVHVDKASSYAVASYPRREEVLDNTLQTNFILNVKQYLKKSNITIDSQNPLTFILKTEPEFRIIATITGVRAAYHIILMTDDGYKIITRTAEIHNVDTDISPTDGAHKHNTLSELLN